jgi:hypothetical protein
LYPEVGIAQTRDSPRSAGANSVFWDILGHFGTFVGIAARPRQDEVMQEERLTINQRRAIVALTSAASLEEAAGNAGVNRRTLFRWLRLPHFRKALREARSQVFAAALAGVHHVVSRSGDILAEIIDNRDASPAARVSAVRAALRAAQIAQQTDEFEERLASLEAAAAAAKAPKLERIDDEY